MAEMTAHILITIASGILVILFVRIWTATKEGARRWLRLK